MTSIYCKTFLFAVAMLALNTAIKPKIANHIETVQIPIKNASKHTQLKRYKLSHNVDSITKRVIQYRTTCDRGGYRLILPLCQPF